MPVCPQCNCCFPNHPKVCPNANARTFGETHLKSIQWQSTGIGKYSVRKETFERILQKIKNMKTGEVITTRGLLDSFGTLNDSTGNVYQNFLDLLVCSGILKKQFNPKGHQYTKNGELEMCTCLKIIKNKRGVEAAKCDFDWKLAQELKYTSKDFIKE